MDSDALDLLITAGESLTVEFKASLSQNQERDICKEIAALSTAQGGTLLIGVSDDKNIIGIDEPSFIINKIERWCIDLVAPQPVINCYPINLRNKTIVVVEVSNGISPIYSYREKFYTRVGTSSVVLSAKAVVDVIRGRKVEDIISSFESTLSLAYTTALSAASSAVAAQYAVAPGIIGQGELATLDYEHLKARFLADIEKSSALLGLRSAMASINSDKAAAETNMITTSVGLESLRLAQSIHEATLKTEIASLQTNIAVAQSMINRLSSEISVNNLHHCSASETYRQSHTIDIMAINSDLISLRSSMTNIESKLALVKLEISAIKSAWSS